MDRMKGRVRLGVGLPGAELLGTTLAQGKLVSRKLGSAVGMMCTRVRSSHLSSCCGLGLCGERRRQRDQWQRGHHRRRFRRVHLNPWRHDVQGPRRINP